MTCDEFKDHFHERLDERINPDAAEQLDAHAQGCTACGNELAHARAVSAALKNPRLAYAAPAALKLRIEALGRAPVIKARPRRFWPLAAAASLAIVVTAGLMLYRMASTAPGELVMRDAIASHIRSLMAAHITDVTSTDQHTVKPWFNGKLAFAPHVEDFAAKDFALIGGRLDYIADTQVAALVYQRRKHTINVFTWPSGEAGSAEGTAFARRGYNVLHWTDKGMTYWAVSDLNAAELAELKALIDHSPETAK